MSKSLSGMNGTWNRDDSAVSTIMGRLTVVQRQLALALLDLLDLQSLIMLQECDAIEGQLKGYVLNFKGQAKLKIFLDQDAQGSLPGARIPWFGGLISGTDLLRLHQRLVKRCHSWSQSAKAISRRLSVAMSRPIPRPYPACIAILATLLMILSI